jgi:hypothetical protein
MGNFFNLETDHMAHLEDLKRQAQGRHLAQQAFQGANRKPRAHSRGYYVGRVAWTLLAAAASWLIVSQLGSLTVA